MHIFYTPDISNDLYALSQEESKHCIKVLRLKTDDKIQLINGKGKLFTTVIIDDNPKKCIVKVTDIQEEKNRKVYHFQIAVAPTKNINRFETFLENEKREMTSNDPNKQNLAKCIKMTDHILRLL